MRKKFNTLVISDLHLGEDLSLSATPATTDHLRLLERQLVGFLHYYSNRRRNGRGWRLVINGDMVDFLTVCVLPGDKRLGDNMAEFSKDEQLFGLHRSEEASRVKMLAVVDRHFDVFRAMARFIAGGNRIDIISGNHDAEFCFPKVQSAFRAGVARAWQAEHEAARMRPMDAAAVDGAVGFHGWFIYEDGVWIEHGHRYDECSSFDTQLEPTDPSGAIATNVDGAGSRYVTNNFVEAEPHSLQEWGFVGYVRFGWDLGLRGGIRLAYSYLLFVASVLAVWRKESRLCKAARDRRRRHNMAVAELAEDTGLDAEALAKVDGLRRKPVVGSLRKLAQVLMLDRLAIVLVTLTAALSFATLLPFGFDIVGVIASLAIGRQLSARAARLRQVNPEEELEGTPPSITQHVDARYVVFGHTHEPIARQFDGDRWHFNTGTWMPTTKPGLLRSFTHVIIVPGEHNATAGLYQWRDGASRAFTPGWAPELAPAGADIVPVTQPAAAPAVATASVAEPEKAQAA